MTSGDSAKKDLMVCFKMFPCGFITIHEKKFHLQVKTYKYLACFDVTFTTKTESYDRLIYRRILSYSPFDWAIVHQVL